MPDVQEAIRIFQDKRVILSIDDDSVNQTVIQTLFEGDGYTIVPASNGIIGLEKLDEMRKEPPDLILLDIMMPGMSGYEVIDRIRKEHPAELPIIFISAKTSIADKCEGLGHLCHDYQPKPFEKDELVHRAKAFIVLRNLRQLEVDKAMQIKQLELAAPLLVTKKVRDNPHSLINERLSSVNINDYYIPYSLFEQNQDIVLPYMKALFETVEKIVSITNNTVQNMTDGGPKLLMHQSGNGFRLLFSVNDEKVNEVKACLNSTFGELMQTFPYMKPHLVSHRVGNSAASIIHGNFQYIVDHPSFVPKITEKTEDDSASGDPGGDGGKEAMQIEFIEMGSDNPEDDLQAIHNAVVASVPPMPWFPKKIDDKPKIIVVEEMDLNDISEIFLLRSRLAFLETQRGVIREVVAKEEIPTE